MEENSGKPFRPFAFLPLFGFPSHLHLLLEKQNEKREDIYNLERCYSISNG